MFNPNAVTENLHPVDRKPYWESKTVFREQKLGAAAGVGIESFKNCLNFYKNLRNYWSKNGGSGRNFFWPRKRAHNLESTWELPPQDWAEEAVASTQLAELLIPGTSRLHSFKMTEAPRFHANLLFADVDFLFSIHFHDFFHDFSARWCRWSCNCCGWGAAGSGEFSPFAFSRERRGCEFLGGVDLGKSFRIILKAPKKKHILCDPGTGPDRGGLWTCDVVSCVVSSNGWENDKKDGKKGWQDVVSEMSWQKRQMKELLSCLCFFDLFCLSDLHEEVQEITEELQEDTGIYDALGCQVRADFPEWWWLSVKMVTGRGTACHTLDALFGMVCSRFSDEKSISLLCLFSPQC